MNSFFSLEDEFMLISHLLLFLFVQFRVIIKGGTKALDARTFGLNQEDCPPPPRDKVSSLEGRKVEWGVVEVEGWMDEWRRKGGEESSIYGHRYRERRYRDTRYTHTPNTHTHTEERHTRTPTKHTHTQKREIATEKRECMCLCECVCI